MYFKSKTKSQTLISYSSFKSHCPIFRDFNSQKTVITKPFHHIAIGVAFSPNLKANLAEASRLALKLKTELVLIHVGNYSVENRTSFKDALPKNTELPSLRMVFVTGDPVKSILKVVKQENIDLLILGALKEENFFKYYMGSIARKITKTAKCSILLVINPSLTESHYHHIVVNGFKEAHTEKTINTAFYVGHNVNSSQITIVEEIAENQVAVKVEDDKTLRKATILKEKLERQEEHRIKEILATIDQELKNNIKINSQPIFGKRGYSIGHYAQIARADLLVMNAPHKTTFLDRLFPHDMEHILNELPTDVLIVR